VEGSVDAERHQFTGDRASIREATTRCALQGVLLRLPRFDTLQSEFRKLK
jgi:hypothetical protein